MRAPVRLGSRLSGEMPEVPDEKLAGRSTGPRTKEGKRRSSQNARTHGCTSRKLILPGESPAEYELLRADWMADYRPEEATAVELVEQTVQAHWFYLRVQKQCDRAEAGMENQNPLEWGEEEWKRRERLGRYRTAAERSFHRALGAIEARRKSRRAEQERGEAAEERARRIEIDYLLKIELQERNEQRQKLRDKKGEMRRLEQKQEQRRRESRKVAQAREKLARQGGESGKASRVVVQWVTVEVAAGVTETEYSPSNAELLKELEGRKVRPERVERHLLLPAGMPPEYAWTNPHCAEECAETRAGRWCGLCGVSLVGGVGIQRMPFETWRLAIEQEALMLGGHAGPMGGAVEWEARR